MIDWSKVETLDDATLESLREAEYSEDPLVLRIMYVLAAAHRADLVYGGSAILAPGGPWESTLEAVAMLIARELRDDLR